MPKLRIQLSVSLDGFVAGPEQSEENPLGIGGDHLHDWMVKLAAFNSAHGRGDEGEVNESTEVAENMFTNVGAHIMGRNMFGGGPGDWGDGSWKGWWGDDPPFHAPVFVLTHFEREPLVMEGGTTFHFVTDGIESALDQAREAAGEKDCFLNGGADIARQFMSAGAVDQIELNLVPLMLGDGERLFDGVPDLGLKLAGVVDAPDVTHLTYVRGD